MHVQLILGAIMRIVLFLLCFLATSAFAQTATLTPSGDLRTGAALSVQWTGPNGAGDWVGLAPVGSAGSAWVGSSYAYTSAGNPVSFALPAQAGAYELRYVTGASQILASRPVTVTQSPPPSGATLSPMGGLVAGGTLSVGWSGPNGAGDWVGLAPVGSAGSAWVGNSYAYTSSGNPVSFAMPTEGGTYELRYVTAASQILFAIPLTVPAPAQAPAASK